MLDLQPHGEHTCGGTTQSLLTATPSRCCCSIAPCASCTHTRFATGSTMYWWPCNNPSKSPRRPSHRVPSQNWAVNGSTIAPSNQSSSGWCLGGTTVRTAGPHLTGSVRMMGCTAPGAQWTIGFGDGANGTVVHKESWLCLTATGPAAPPGTPACPPRPPPGPDGAGPAPTAERERAVRHLRQRRDPLRGSTVRTAGRCTR